MLFSIVDPSVIGNAVDLRLVVVVASSFIPPSGKVGFLVGIADGCFVGLLEGCADGFFVGEVVGTLEGG